ncbi:MAG: flagellar basal body rod protein FlgC [Myxococcales bacterium]|nr:flagellar basal body rod protein FlgC [Myxococcales bacterium]
MNMFSAMEIAASGLYAQRTRMNALASNLANARTTRTAEGGPYRRLDPVFEAVPATRGLPGGARGPGAFASYLVEVAEMRPDDSPPQRLYDPGHPDADAEGFIELPNVNVVEEMVNMISASRAYESGVSLVQTIERMAGSALSIGA